mmetsp:Transcript_15442/g.33200  ORF Transcript_15442/g.33200 Transcript_15442/m.33200 type:complete len:283 (-) Transcript_15442:113-961(-)
MLVEPPAASFHQHSIPLPLLLSNKRPYSSIITLPSSYKHKRFCDSDLDNDSNNNSTKRNKSKKSIQFSESVNVRFFIQYVPQLQQGKQDEDIITATSHPMDINGTKNYVRALSKLHNLIRRSKNNNTQVTPATGASTTTATSSNNIDNNDDNIGNTIRYEINGESLRGMEHMTELIIGRKRLKTKIMAIKVVTLMTEQQEQQQLEQQLHYVSSDSSDDTNNDGKNTTSTTMARKDKSKKGLGNHRSTLAEMYRLKARQALLYAIRVGEEDAKVAAEILAEDI